MSPRAPHCEPTAHLLRHCAKMNWHMALKGRSGGSGRATSEGVKTEVDGHREYENPLREVDYRDNPLQSTSVRTIARLRNHTSFLTWMAQSSSIHFGKETFIMTRPAASPRTGLKNDTPPKGGVISIIQFAEPPWGAGCGGEGTPRAIHPLQPSTPCREEMRQLAAVEAGTP